MLRVVIGIILILVGIQAFLRRRQAVPAGPRGQAEIIAALFGGPLAGLLMVLAGLGFLASTSFLLISADKVG